MKQVKIDNFLLNLKKPGRYSGNEINSKKKRISEKTLNFALAFPDLYEIGMSHLGLKILYSIVNSKKNFAADRVFAPDIDLIKLLKDKDIPLFSIEDKIPLHCFDVLGFTLQYELSYPNILMMLELGGIPIFSEKRTEFHPVVIAGGPGAFNPEPLAKFIDAFVVGDGEEIIIDIGKTLLSTKNEKRDKKLKELAQLTGVYVPKFYKQVNNKLGSYIIPKIPDIPKRIKKNIFTDFDNKKKLHNPQLVPIIDVVHNRASIEIMRGCTRGCRFCQAGMIYRPLRERSVDLIIELFDEERLKNGWAEISLSSLSSSDYSSIQELLPQLTNKLYTTHTNLALPSLRIDTFSKDLAKKIKKVFGSSLTLALEAGSQRLRKIINKNITDNEIFNAVKTALSIGIRSLKLYFMLGLPYEEKEDIDAIITLINKINSIDKNNKLKKININITTFIPKPHTPFQWTPQRNKQYVIKNIYRLKENFSHQKKIKIKYNDIENSMLETIIARGDRKIGDLIYVAYKLGAIFTSWTEHFEFELWEKAAIISKINLYDYLSSYTKRTKFPWSHIDAGIKEEYLWNEYEKAKKIKTTNDCRNSICLDCGICKHAKKVIINQNNTPKTYEYIPYRKKDERNETVYKYRIYYEKCYRMKFCSHKELTKHIYRILRISKLPIFYTKGYNKRPKISFCPPLSLGICGRKEFFDIFLYDKINSKEIIKGISINLPEGLFINDVQLLNGLPKKKSKFENEELKIIFNNSFDWKSRLSLIENCSIINKRGENIDLVNLVNHIKKEEKGFIISKKISGIRIFDILFEVLNLPKKQIGFLDIERLSIS